MVTAAALEDRSIPPAIPVGRVERVGVTDDRTEQTLVIEPVADLRSLSYVTCPGLRRLLVITWLKVALVIFTTVLLQVTVVAKLPIADVRADIVLLVAIAARATVSTVRSSASSPASPSTCCSTRRSGCPRSRTAWWGSWSARSRARCCAPRGGSPSWRRCWPARSGS